jgi:hypothetical protein
MIGGALKVTSAQEHGTTVTCIVRQEAAHAGHDA